MKLEIRTLRGKIHYFKNIEESQTIESLKALYAIKSGNSIKIIHLVGSGIELENWRTIKSYKLHENSYIHVVISRFHTNKIQLSSRFHWVRINPRKLKF